MIKFYKKLFTFFTYRKNVKNNLKFLNTKYSLNRNSIYELYTTIVLTDAPTEVKEQYGNELANYEIKKYIHNFNIDLEKISLEELINIYDIKKINGDLYGIAFGFSLMKNIRVYFYIFLHIFLFLLITGLIILL